MSVSIPTNLRDCLEMLPDLGARPQNEMRSRDFSLERITWLTNALGNPEKKYPSFHVAGTNGKGSVCAFLSSALNKQGYRVGIFTSPHLRGALEGIVINEDVVGIDMLQKSFEAMIPHLQTRSDWTQFEVVTALTLLHFSLQGVDTAVIEVGIGGRLDATNVITPLVSVITPIDLDHTSILGSTLTQIAHEKAGIIKPGIPVVMAPQEPEAGESILAAAMDRRSQLIEVGADWVFERNDYNLTGQNFRIWKPAEVSSMRRLRIGMHGAHQIQNAATGYAALLTARDKGLELSDAAIQRGLAEARWPGRFEIIQESPALILDAAHSPAAVAALRLALDEYFPRKTIHVVLGVSADKNLVGLVDPMGPRLGRVVATQSLHPRAMPADKLSSELRVLGVNARPEQSPRKAMEKVLRETSADDVVLVWGSVFLVEEVREFQHLRLT